MKIYLCCPMVGTSIDDAEAVLTFAEAVVEAKGHKALNPLELCMDGALMYNEGKAVQTLSESDAIVMLGDWKSSTDCLMMYFVWATLSRIKVFNSLEQIDTVL